MRKWADIESARTRRGSENGRASKSITNLGMPSQGKNLLATLHLSVPTLLSKRPA